MIINNIKNKNNKYYLNFIIKILNNIINKIIINNINIF